jgi:hypothetical protein
MDAVLAALHAWRPDHGAHRALPALLDGGLLYLIFYRLKPVVESVAAWAFDTGVGSMHDA